MSDLPILFDKPIPESQVSAPYQRYTHPVLGTVFITSGFMEPTGHGYKSSPRKAIYADGSIQSIAPGHYNIGIDYSRGFGATVICHYSGVVAHAGFESGYGHRIHIRLDLPFVYQGRSHVCYQAYGHCLKLLRGVGQRVSQGDAIAIEAGHGSSGPNDYPSHVDLDTYCVIDDETYHINPDLLATSVNPDDMILPVTLLRKGSRGDAVRWLQIQLGIDADGVFGDDTLRAVLDYQWQQGDLEVDGLAGELTATRLGLVEYALFPKQAGTAFSALSDPAAVNFEFTPTDPPTPLLANWLQDHGDHWKLELKQKRQERHNWYVLKKHVSVVRGYSSPIEDRDDVITLGDLAQISSQVVAASQGRWDLALEVCPTSGCSMATASPEGLTEAGVAASHEIMRRDLLQLNDQRRENLRRAGSRFQVPVEVILAIASRESHLGAVLGAFGSDPGWGDNNQAWGIMQVDRRYHSLHGLDDPFSQAHIEQALAIFASYRDAIINSHPDWADEYVLKGACVAYNSGVNNVQTIAGMNQGTTHNDYGDDVIARAQFCRGMV